MLKMYFLKETINLEICEEKHETIQNFLVLGRFKVIW